MSTTTRLATTLGQRPSAPTEQCLLDRSDHTHPSVFLPEHLLREARRQRRLDDAPVPTVCVLDPDGDIAAHLARTGGALSSRSWACYHTDLLEAEFDGMRVGVVARAVGAPFAVLVAEELFASGCELLISITSAGAVAAGLPQSCTILIDRALRGEGASYAYLPPASTVAADPMLVEAVAGRLAAAGLEVIQGMTWTTDAPFRETAAALDAAEAAGALAVEMEAAGLYAFAAARRRSVVCFAHVTNALAVAGSDFDKGPDDGVAQALRIAIAAALGWSTLRSGTA